MTPRPSKAWLVDKIPARAWRIFRQLRPRRPGGDALRVECEGRYASFEAAASAARDTYNDEAIVAGLLDKTMTFREQLAARPLLATPAIERMATVLGLLAPIGRTLSVIDFGGGFGTHYWIARALLDPSVALRWYVVETEETCRRVAADEHRLGRGPTGDELRYFDDLDRAVAAMGSPDLLYSDGVIQVLPDPLAGLARLVAAGVPRLCIRRVAVTPQHLHTVLKIPLSMHEPDVPLPPGTADRITSIPATFVEQAAIERIITQRYQIRVRFGTDTPTYRDASITMHTRGYFAVQADGTK